jgi:metal-sulfur cluster biosynthetic enzyme
MITREGVMSCLEGVIDPEIGINVVDLGLIYDVRIDDDGMVRVKMTLTTPGCPMHEQIARAAVRTLKRMDGVKDANVEVVWEPPWTPERLSSRAKVLLGFL